MIIPRSICAGFLSDDSPWIALGIGVKLSHPSATFFGRSRAWRACDALISLRDQGGGGRQLQPDRSVRGSIAEASELRVATRFGGSSLETVQEADRPLGRR